MQFRCPKCNYILTGTPDECPLCHAKLNYAVEGGMIPDMPKEEAKPSEESKKVEEQPVKTKEDIEKEKQDKAKKAKIKSFNIMAIIFNVVCLAFILEALLYPTMLLPTTGSYSLYIPINSVAEPTMFSLLDYYVYQIMGLVEWLKAFTDLGDPTAVIPLFVSFFFSYFEILMLALGLLLIFFSLICNISNLAKGKLPKYVRKSAIERFHDPLNPMGHIITFCVFLGLNIFLPPIINEFFINVGIDVVTFNTAINEMHVNAIFTIYLAMFVVILVGIIKGAMRSSVNPKVYPGESR